MGTFNNSENLNDGRNESSDSQDLSTDIRVYTPERQVGWGLRVWREMIEEALVSSELAWRLFRRDFSARYRQSVIGIVWALLLPLIVVGTFVILNHSGLLKVGDTGVPYPVYALLGLSIWQIFGTGLSACTNSIVAGGSMVVKVNFAKETLIIAAMGQSLVEFLVRVLLLSVVMLCFQVIPKWTAIFLPLTLMPLVILTVGLGALLSLANAAFRDVVNIVSVATTFLMFLTPVVYPIPKKGMLGTFVEINPLASLVTASKDMVFAGYLTDPVGFAWSSALAVVLFVISWRVFHLAEFKMAEII